MFHSFWQNQITGYNNTEFIFKKDLQGFVLIFLFNRNGSRSQDLLGKYKGLTFIDILLYAKHIWYLVESSEHHYTTNTNTGC